MSVWKVAVAGILTLFALVAGVVGAVDYFAKEGDLQLVEYRLNEKIRNDQIYDIRVQLWQLEDRHKGVAEHEWPPEDLDRHRNLRHKLEKLQRVR